MFYSGFTQTGNTPIYAGKTKEVPEEYQEQPQRKMRDMWKQKYFTLHLMHYCLSSILSCNLQRKAGWLVCPGSGWGQALSPHTTGSSARSLRHRRALQGHWGHPCQVSSTATCWRADSKGKASSLNNFTQAEMHIPQAHQHQDCPRQPAHIIPCTSSAAL